MSATSTPRTQASGATAVILWALSLLAGAFFLAMAYPKLTASARTVAAFEMWGYGPAFMRWLGWAEVAGGLALIVPRLTTWGAVLLSLEMLGGIYTILASGMGLLGLPVICLAVLAIVGWHRRDRAIGLATLF